MNDISMRFWHELSPAEQHDVVTVLGNIAVWMQAARTRPSSIVVAFAQQTPLAAVVTLHDRVVVGAAVIDVAVVRHVTHVADFAHAHIVQLVMHQAMAFIEEGLGLVLVSGNVAEWSQYGFAPVSHRVRVAWNATLPALAVAPDRAHVRIPTRAEQQLIQSMTLTATQVSVRIVDWAAWPDRPWLLLYGTDGQLCAAADIVVHGGEQRVVQAVASNDGAASDLVGHLLYGGLVAQPVVLQLPITHSVTQMAMHYQGVLQMASAGGQAVLLGVLDLPMMLTALIPAFEQRLRASTYMHWNGSIRIEISDERAMLMVSDGKVSVIDGTREADVRIKQVELVALAQMAFGYRSVGGLRRAGLLMCDDTELPLCDVLFPALYPQISLE